MIYRLGQLLAFLLFALGNIVTFGNLSPIVTVSVIIMKDQQILAIDHHDGRGFFLPGGLMKAGETIEQTVKRETKEETGLLVKPGSFIGIYERPTGSFFHIPTLTLVYGGQIVGGKLKNSAEGSVIWVKPNEIKNERDIISDFLAKNNNE